MPKIEQAPGSFITDDGIRSDEKKRIKSQKAYETGIGATQVLSNKSCRTSYDSQHKNQCLSPYRALSNMKPQQALKVKIPWLHMLRSSSRTLEPMSIGANGIQWS